MTKAEMNERIDAARQLFQDEAREVFCGNPHWAGQYADAPEGAKAYLTALFACTLREWIEASEDDWRQVTSSMTADDWRYLARASGNQMAKAFYLKAANAVQEGGSVALKGAPEILNPYVDLA